MSPTGVVRSVWRRILDSAATAHTAPRSPRSGPGPKARWRIRNHLEAVEAQRKVEKIMEWTRTNMNGIDVVTEIDRRGRVIRRRLVSVDGRFIGSLIPPGFLNKWHVRPVARMDGDRLVETGEERAMAMGHGTAGSIQRGAALLVELDGLLDDESKLQGHRRNADRLERSLRGPVL